MPGTTVILPQRDFQQAVSPLLVGDNRWATAPLHTRTSAGERELIVGEWTPRDHPPQGDEFPPLTEFAVLTSNATGRQPAARLPELIHPKRSHLVLGISLEPRDRSLLPVCLWEHERVLPITAVRLIGPRLIRLPDETAVEPLVSERSSRPRGALRDLYDRVGTLAGILIGAGGGASELARQLVAAGLRRLAIIDPDHLGPENLDAMPHTSPRQLGRSKAVLLAKALQRSQPDLALSCLADSITSAAGLTYLDRTRADTVFSFVDNDSARLATSWKCRQGMMVHLDVGTLIRHEESGRRVMRADIRLFEPGRGCVACVPKLPNLENALYEVSAPPGTLHRGRPVPWDQQRSGSLLHPNALACSLAVELWLGYVAGTIRTSHWIRVHWPEGAPPRIEAADVQPADDCPFCHPRHLTGRLT